MFHYSVKDGLASKEVHSIFQDSKGYIWISSDAGITKYNANAFKTFDVTNGLPDNTVFEVFEDSLQRIWYRTLSGGIGYIFNDSVFIVKANKKIIELQNKGIIESFAMEKDGSILLGRLGTDECFFIKVVPPYNESDVKKVVSNCIRTIGIDAILICNKIVFSENRYLNPKFKKQNETNFFKIVVRDVAGKMLLLDSVNERETSSISKFFIHDSGVYYISQRLFINYNFFSKKKIKEYFQNEVISLLNEGDKLLLGCRKEGVIEYNTFSQQILSENYLKDKSISDIKKDNTGGYWYGTLEDGVYYCPNKDYYKIKVFKNAKEKPEIMCFEKLNDSCLVIETNEGSVYSLKIKNGIISKETLIYKSINKISVKDIKLKRLSNTKILISQNPFYSELLEIKNDKLIKAQKTTIVPKTILLAKNYLISSLIKKIEFSDTDNLKIVRTIEFDDRITSMTFDKINEEIYFGGLHGLYSFNINSNAAPKKILSNIFVEDIIKEQGSLFIATKANGLIIKRGFNYDTITVGNNLLSNFCRKLFFINSNLWLLTSRGLSRINYSDYKNYTVKNYAFSEYVLPETIENITSINNSLVFFDKNELLFYPIEQKEIKQPFRISGIFVNNKLISNEGEIKLNNNQSDISVNFEALFFSNNRSINYRYKFAGIDSVWKYIDRPNLNFPSLSPGSYKLILQAKNRNGDWVSCKQDLVFNIDKPFWLKWWFILIEIFIGITVLSFITYYRYKNVITRERAKNILNNKLHEFEVRTIKAQMNPHFIFNSMNSIQLFILNRKNDLASEYLSKFSELLRSVLETNVKDNLTLQEEIELLSGYLELEKLRFQKEFHFTISVNEKVDTLNINIPHFLIQPFVENAIWHGLLPKKDNRELSIKFEYRDSRTIFCSIEDNGVGREVSSKKNKSFKKKSLALSFVNQRLELINKSMNLDCSVEIIDKMNENGESEGTKIIIILPIVNK